MRWRLIRCVLVVAAAALGVHPIAAGRTPPASPLLQRFLALDDPDPVQVRALRHLEASNERFRSEASMEVWTDADASGFRYEIVAEQGSDYIRFHILRAALDAERDLWRTDTATRAAFTPANYEFVDTGDESDGLTSLAVKPRRRDMFLVDGSIFLRADDGELVKMDGRLAKPPSFWTRSVHVTRWYQRFAGVRMPVAVESVARLVVAGDSRFRMSYDYESVNGRRVGAPRPRS
jgi:hypothetical protein